MIKKLKLYNEITNFSLIARRYFVNNFYDGMLTILGVLLGFFVILLNNPSQPILSSYIILTSLGTSISMLVSGISGSYLSESAEQKRIKRELDKAMVNAYDSYEDTEENPEEIRKAMLTELNSNYDNTYLKKKKKEKNQVKIKKIKTLHEKAERFAVIIVSLINGFSPFFGGIVAIIPFFFVKEAEINCFIISFIIIFVCIIFLGVFLDVISEESKLKNVVQMLGAFIITIVIILVFFS